MKFVILSIKRSYWCSYLGLSLEWMGTGGGCCFTISDDTQKTMVDSPAILTLCLKSESIRASYTRLSLVVFLVAFVQIYAAHHYLILCITILLSHSQVRAVWPSMVEILVFTGAEITLIRYLLFIPYLDGTLDLESRRSLEISLMDL